MLVDKGYYDYDFQSIAVINEEKKKNGYTDLSEIMKVDNDKIERDLAKYGLGKYADNSQNKYAAKNPKEMSIEELQAYAMQEKGE